MKKSKIMIAMLITTLMVSVLYGGSLIYDSIHNKTNSNMSTVTISGSLDSTLTAVTSSSFDIYKFAKTYTNIIPVMFYDIKVSEVNAEDTVEVNIYEYESIDGINYYINDTLFYVTDTLYSAMRKSIDINDIYAGRKISFSPVADSCSDSLSFVIKAYILNK